ncbi:probable Splicing factor 3b, subunit 2 [Melanopsichium pennsylvanicum]|uniref:Probable Splicing factor 3b, subunit 2 n=2 Tax=Melanopsichium pennsylvanicum TaxID=63383 RepID=A0AAJ5C7M7_9BASI|nr:probable Splicing factor 3b, subunit 2 [Melanopsichium pennsylvanicum 4]SNX86728.1 probable Splicing factor 3b, subunit 2 [Melanopsichium pennsylvanicum]
MTTNAVAGPSNAKIPLTKNAKRRFKKKQQQQQQQFTSTSTSISSQTTASSTLANHTIKQDSEHDQPDEDDDQDSGASPSIIDQAADFRIDPESQVYKAFSNVLSRYQPQTLSQQQQPSKGQIIYSDDDLESEYDFENEESIHTSHLLSKRKQKKLQRLSVAELKQLVRKPAVVEWTDVTSNDPRLLVHLKCIRNSVPIPPHWATKRDYLQNKRGIEKPQYQLPSYIADTGIATIKDALKEKEAEQSLKQKTRERVQPKMGKMDIDYQKLYDAFFKFQSKPHLSPYGDTYYEAKEYETKFKHQRPGQLSNQLIDALSIPPLAPPPWLIAMQRYGPPPSYPHLQIPGLNAPIPQGAQWGFHPGGWGRPPVDEYGNPLYGNVLGVAGTNVDPDLVDKVEKEHWGQLEPEESDVEEEEEDQQEEEEPEEQQQQKIDRSGLQSVSSLGAGLQTPSFIELRKEARHVDSQPPPTSSSSSRLEGDGAPSRSLYQVLPERTATGSNAGQFMASEKVYDMSSSTHSSHAANNVPVLGSESDSSLRRGIKRSSEAVQVSINPDELETGAHDTQRLGARYDQERKIQSQTKFRYGDDGDQQGVAEVREELQRERRKEEQRRANRSRH